MSQPPPAARSCLVRIRLFHSGNIRTFVVRKNADQLHKTSRMRAIIPVAGVGSRLRPHTYTVPKVLLNVAGKPIIGHILDKVIENGFDEATIVIGYLGEQIKEYILEHYSIKVDFVEQEE